MSANDLQLHLVIDQPNADPERLDNLTRYLMRDLRDLGVESVERAPGEKAPDGSKSPSAFTWGALAISTTPVFLPKLIEFLQALTLRGEKRTVKIKTPTGLEVEFTPEKRLSHDELADLVAKLSQT